MCGGWYVFGFCDSEEYFWKNTLFPFRDSIIVKHYVTALLSPFIIFNALCSVLFYKNVFELFAVIDVYTKNVVHKLPYGSITFFVRYHIFCPNVFKLGKVLQRNLVRKFFPNNTHFPRWHYKNPICLKSNLLLCFNNKLTQWLVIVE